mmetsp:Transcript_7497/g.21898  ORF Transcript_7497/g.21898 Transcript_7497/m.21898 type:complete len:199 (-) Transcript_7497:141-737(-)
MRRRTCWLRPRTAAWASWWTRLEDAFGSILDAHGAAELRVQWVKVHALLCHYGGRGSEARSARNAVRGGSREAVGSARKCGSPPPSLFPHPPGPPPLAMPGHDLRLRARRAHCRRRLPARAYPAAQPAAAADDAVDVVQPAMLRNLLAVHAAAGDVVRGTAETHLLSPLLSSPLLILSPLLLSSLPPSPPAASSRPNR